MTLPSLAGPLAYGDSVDATVTRFGRQVSLTLALTAATAVMSALPWYEEGGDGPARTPWALVRSSYVDRDALGFLLSVLTVVALIALGACAALVVHYGEDGPGWAAFGTAAATAAAVLPAALLLASAGFGELDRIRPGLVGALVSSLALATSWRATRRGAQAASAW